VLLAANDNDALHIAPGGTWKVVQNLKPGDHVRTALRGVDAITGAATAGDETLTVVAVTLDRAPTRVYNLEVRTLHSFAVGELGEWVHNAGSGAGGRGRGRPRPPDPGTDSSGRVHGPLPNAGSVFDIEQSIEALLESIGNRCGNRAKFGLNTGHGKRLAEERKLLEKLLDEVLGR